MVARTSRRLVCQSMAGAVVGGVVKLVLFVFLKGHIGFLVFLGSLHLLPLCTLPRGFWLLCWRFLSRNVVGVEVDGGVGGDLAQWNALLSMGNVLFGRVGGLVVQVVHAGAQSGSGEAHCEKGPMDNQKAVEGIVLLGA